jgi:hypothetical protein
VNLVAQVQWRHGADVYILRVRNASHGGLFLEGAPEEHPGLKQGGEVELALLPEDDLTRAPIGLRAKVVRIDKAGAAGRAGFGLSILTVEPGCYDRFAALLKRAGA